MADIQLYREYLNLDTPAKISEEFRKTLVTTNRSFLFYVDWKKVKRNVGTINTELSLLDSLINSHGLKKDFYDLLKKYPEVVKVLPILLAIRELSFDVIENFDEKDTDIIKYSFNRKEGEALSDGEIESYYNLIEKSGAKDLFTTIKSFKDYIFGVEVGMDTNARKNRSGNAMEVILAPLMSETAADHGIMFFAQKQFGSIERETGITFPDLLRNKKFDFFFAKNGKGMNIEVNFFAGGGSKQEIINSYIDRQAKLKSAGADFMLVTDGQAWNKNVNNELDSGFDALDYILNLAFVRRGFFTKVVENVFKA